MAKKDPFILKKFDGGWVTEVISDALDVNQSPDMQNGDFSASGSIKKTYGYQELGADVEDAVNSRLIVVPDRTGIQWLMKKCGTKLKIYDATIGRYDVIKTGLTSGDYLAFEYFDNTVYFNSAVDTPFTLDLTKITRLDGAILAGATTIKLVTGAAFTALGATGVVFINGVAVTYTGKTADSLTGCSATPAVPASVTGSLAVQATVDKALMKKGIVMCQYVGRLFVASGSTIYGSKLVDFTNFTVAGAGTGDAIQKTIESKCNALKVFTDDNGNRRMMAFAADDKIYVLDTDDNATISSTITTCDIFKQNAAALNQAATIVGPNDVYYIDLNNQVRSMGTKYAAQGVNRVYSDSISKQHKFLFKYGYNFDKSRAIVNNDEYWCATIEGKGGLNNRVIIYDFATSSWRKRTNINATDLAVYGNKIIFSDVALNRVYVLNEELKSDNDENIYFKYSTPDLDIEKLRFERLRHVRISGFMSKACISTVKIYKDFGTSLIGEFTLRGDDNNINGSVLGNLAVYGSMIYGEEVIGGDPSNNVRFFIADLELDNLPDLENFRIVLENDQANVDFEITAVKPFVFQQSENYYPQKYILNTN